MGAAVQFNSVFVSAPRHKNSLSLGCTRSGAIVSKKEITMRLLSAPESKLAASMKPGLAGSIVLALLWFVFGAPLFVAVSSCLLQGQGQGQGRIGPFSSSPQSLTVPA
jgi:hypothetical protein